MENNRLKPSRKFSDFLFERALPNEYLVVVGKKNISPVLGGKKFRWFNKFIHVPAFVQRLKFSTDNANVDYQGIEIHGYASWRINPDNPAKSIATLDFFDENDPMFKTNEELKTICIEAVRHTIANMSIDDALKKKDDIADSLFVQLKTIEDKWGIIFDQVGIEQVRVMSGKLFQDMQSEFRSKLRLNASVSQLHTDREISRLNNETHEKNMKEQLETEQKLELIRIDNATKIKQKELAEEMSFSEQKRQYDETLFRNEMIFKMEKEEKENTLLLLKNKLQTELNNLDIKLMESLKMLEEQKTEIARKQLSIKELELKIEQTISQDKLRMEFIQKLPEVFEAIKIQNYSVLETSKDKNISPVLKMIHEILFALKSSGIELFGNEKNQKD